MNKKEGKIKKEELIGAVPNMNERIDELQSKIYRQDCLLIHGIN